MRSVFFVLLTSVLAIFSACPTASVDGDTHVESSSTEAPPNDRQPVLVELFTSEGCSSCPPADRNLAFLEKQQPVAKADIVTLAFHVDYWDRLGWKDRFSSPLFSRRQEIYSQAFKLGSNYTPQMVVDGREEFVGSDSGRASKEILNAAETAKASVEVVVEAGRLKVKIAGAREHADATVYAAIAEDGISTRVERGENSGKTLEHVSVVRELKTLGMLAADKKDFEWSTEVQAPADSKVENLKVVVFIQENESRRIVGVGRSAWKQL
jgi:hypothetical protein